MQFGIFTVGDVTISELRGKRLREQQTRIGMIFQRFNLLTSRTVAGNVAYPLEVAGWPRSRRSAWRPVPRSRPTSSPSGPGPRRRTTSRARG